MLVVVLVKRILLFGVYITTPEVWKRHASVRYEPEPRSRDSYVPTLGPMYVLCWSLDLLDCKPEGPDELSSTFWVVGPY